MSDVANPKATICGYGRVSHVTQSLDVQKAALLAAGCDPERLYLEKRSGTTTEGRDQLAAMLDWVRAGDTIKVTRLDRIARSTSDLLEIVKRLESKGVALKCIEQDIDTSGATGRLMVTILAAFAEFETGLRRERQLEGIAAKKAEDADRIAQGLEAATYKGRPPTIKADAIVKLKADGIGATEIAKRLNISRASVYRLSDAAG